MMNTQHDISDKKKANNQNLSLYIKIGASLAKRFKETQDAKIRSIILDCANQTSRLKDKEIIESFVEQYS